MVPGLKDAIGNLQVSYKSQGKIINKVKIQYLYFIVYLGFDYNVGRAIMRVLNLQG